MGMHTNPNNQQHNRRRYIYTLPRGAWEREQKCNFILNINKISKDYLKKKIKRLIRPLYDVNLIELNTQLVASKLEVL